MRFLPGAAIFSVRPLFRIWQAFRSFRFRIGLPFGLHQRSDGISSFRKIDVVGGQSWHHLAYPCGGDPALRRTRGLVGEPFRGVFLDYVPTFIHRVGGCHRRFPPFGGIFPFCSKHGAAETGNVFGGLRVCWIGVGVQIP